MNASRPLRLLLASLCLPLAAQEKPVLTRDLAQVAAAYAAKVAASAIFVSGRTLDSVLAEELAPDHALEALIRPFAKFDVDRDAGTVTCSLGGVTATAVCTQNLGCTLAIAGAGIAALRRRGAPGLASLEPDPAAVDWPRGDRVPPPGAGGDGVDHAALAKVMDAAFAEPAGRPKVHTRAVVVACRGRLVAERYAAGYDAAMPLPGWSMTKSITGALVALAAAAGKLDPAAPLAVPEWPEGDARRALRLSDLMTMTSGLAWNESYDDPASDALRMLFASADHGGVQAQRAPAAPPGTTYRYSSGTTNLVCRELRRAFADDLAYWAFPRVALFAPLGMRSAVVETDPSGTFVGSSYGFATARDWARLGLLYAGDGEFAGQRLLPAGWLAAVSKPVPPSDGAFGRHVWLNADPDGDGPRERMWPDLPADLVHMDGHQGQYVVVFPTQRIVVVRLGCTKSGGFDLRGLLAGVLAACKV
ncbi:MAG: serine hydrolase [Planctomycetota bacterium]